MKWKSSESVVKWSEVKCSVGKGENETLREKFMWVVKWWELKSWGESVIKLCVGKNTRNYGQYFLTLVLFTFFTCCILRCLVCIVVSCLVCIVVVVLCILFSSYVYLLYYVCTAVFTLDAGLLAVIQYWKVLRPATSTQNFLGFPVPISKCWDGSQDSKLPLHASHVALPN